MKLVRPAVFTRDTLLELANSDYDPALVAVSGSRIVATDWPEAVRDPIQIDLPPAVARSDRLEAALAFLITVGALNYRFWGLGADGSLTRYRALGQRGARALWAASIEAWGDDATPETFRRALAAGGVAGVFGDIPDPESREDILAEVLLGVEEAAETLAPWIDHGRAVTVEQAQRLARIFRTGFGDPYLKKAQLVLAMVAGHWSARGMQLGCGDLTAFADYQVPRVLRALGVLQYAPAVAEQVDAGRLLALDGAEERAIRAATILACERIAKHMSCTAAGVDNVLWQAQEAAGEARFHLCETTAY